MGRHKRITQFDGKLLDFIYDHFQISWNEREILEGAGLDYEKDRRHVNKSLRKLHSMGEIVRTKNPFNGRCLYQAPDSKFLETGFIIHQLLRKCIQTSLISMYDEIRDGTFKGSSREFVELDDELMFRLRFSKFDTQLAIVRLLDPDNPNLVDLDEVYSHTSERIQKELDLMDDDEREAALDVIGSPP